jgi:hypothetical protein
VPTLPPTRTVTRTPPPLQRGDIVFMVPIRRIDGIYPVGNLELEPLVRSISQFGVLQPLILRSVDGRFELVAGAHRLAAAMAAGLTEVPCFIVKADDERARELAEAVAVESNRTERTTPTVEQRPADEAPARPAEERHVAPARSDSSTSRTTSPAPAFPAAALTVITEHLTGITSCLNLFGERDRPLRERIAMGLIQAEAQRAGWLTQSIAVLVEDPPLQAEPVALGPLVTRIVAAMNPERVFAGVEIDYDTGSAISVARGDEQLLSIAITGMFAALQPLVERVDGARLRVTLSGHPDAGLLHVELSQHAVRLPKPWHTRFFDATWTERPGGARAGVAVAAARHIAHLHNGALELVELDAGCQLVLTVPAG